MSFSMGWRRSAAIEISVLVLLAVLASLKTPCSAQISDACRYRYVRQPLRILQCNPYLDRSLVTECSVTRGPREMLVDLQWVLLSTQGFTSGIISSSENNIFISETQSASLTITSQLRVEELSDSDAGSYFCQIRFPNGTLTEPSQPLELFTEEVFRAQVSSNSPCSREAQSSGEQLCALVGDIGVGVSLPGIPGGGGGGGGSDGDDGGEGGGPLGSGTSNVVIFTIAGGVILLVVLAILFVIVAVCIHQLCSHSSH